MQFSFHHKMNTRVQDQKLLLQLLKTAWSEPIQLPQDMQCYGLLRTTRSIDDLDGHSETITCSTETLNSLGTALADDLVMGTPHQLGVKTSLPSHKLGVSQHGSADLLHLRMS